MASKRARSDAPAPAASAAPAALATEVYDTLVQCSRKQLAQLLGVFVKASSAQVLERVRAEAVKCGALVESKSRWQHCGWDLLDSFFSFLDIASILSVEPVCARWRYACINGGAGWRKVLQDNGTMHCELKWVQEIARHRIDVSRLTDLYSVHAKPAAVSMVSRLPSLTILNAPQLSASDFACLSKLTSVAELEISDDALGTLATLPMAKSVTRLEVSTWLYEVGALRALPNLKALTVLAHFQPLGRVTQLEELTIKLRYDLPRAELSSLHKLPALRQLVFEPLQPSDGGRLDSTHIADISRITQLRELRLPHLYFHTSDPLRTLSRLTNLTALHVKPAAVERDGGAADVRSSECEFLAKVSSSNLICADMRSLQLTNLTELSGFPRHAHDNDFELLTTLTRLKTLRIDFLGHDFTAAGFAHLNHLPALATIDLGFHRFQNREQLLEAGLWHDACARYDEKLSKEALTNIVHLPSLSRVEFWAPEDEDYYSDDEDNTPNRASTASTRHCWSASDIEKLRASLPLAASSASSASASNASIAGESTSGLSEDAQPPEPLG